LRARDAEATGQLLRGLIKLLLVDVGDVRGLEADEVRRLVEAFRPRDAPRRSRQRFSAACDDGISLSAGDAPDSGEDRLEPRAALLIYCRSRNCLRQARSQCNQPGGIAACRAVAGDDLVNARQGKTGVLQDGHYDRSGQILDAARFMKAADAANRRSPRGDDIGRLQHHLRAHSHT
jgi:hypothetical protein